MKCQRKASPYSACFASRSCARFSPTTVIPASTSTAMSASVDVLRRGDDRHRRPDLVLDAREARADLVRRRHRSPPGRRAPDRRAGARRRARVVARAEIDALDLLDAGARSARSAAVQRSSRPSTGQVGVEALRRPPARPRSSTGRSPGRPRRPSARPRAPPRPPRRRPRRGRASRRGGRRARGGPSSLRPRSAGSRRTSASSGRSGSSVQSPSPGSPRTPGSARWTVGECTWRLNASRSYGTPIDSQAIRRLCSTLQRRRRCRGSG